jgi:3-oxoacyl-[acyl-carrier protein] reductase
VTTSIEEVGVPGRSRAHAAAISRAGWSVTESNVEATEFFRDRLTDARRTRLVADTDTGRPGTVEDIAGTVHFLASPAARQITAQVLNVNGGAWSTR